MLQNHVAVQVRVKLLLSVNGKKLDLVEGCDVSISEAGRYLPVFHVVQFVLFGQEQQAVAALPYVLMPINCCTVVWSPWDVHVGCN